MIMTKITNLLIHNINKFYFIFINIFLYIKKIFISKNNMGGMFDGCSSLKELNLSNFNTNNITNSFGIFSGCSNQFQNKIRAQYKNIKEEAFYNY